jgi:hypothetical protein
MCLHIREKKRMGSKKWRRNITRAGKTEGGLEK